MQWWIRHRVDIPAQQGGDQKEAKVIDPKEVQITSGEVLPKQPSGFTLCPPELRGEGYALWVHQGGGHPPSPGPSAQGDSARPQAPTSMTLPRSHSSFLLSPLCSLQSGLQC